MTHGLILAFVIEMGGLIYIGFGYEEETGSLGVLVRLYLCRVVC